MKTAKCVVACIAIAAFLAVFAFWALSIWTGDDRWAATAMMSFFACIPLSVATALIWTEASIR